jgi:tripartite-type tricarboxylate transporter receptor subunit TctC
VTLSSGLMLSSIAVRIAAAGVVLMSAMLAVPSPAGAQDTWPQRQVTIVVPFMAGGSADLLARILQQHMQAKFGVPFVVENRPGAGGTIGTGYVAKAANDGSTLLLGTVSANVINAFLYSRLSYDAERDFQPVSLLVHLPNLLVVNNKVPANSVSELIAYLKANDGKANFGSSGNGTSSHLSAVMFQLASGTRMTHVPFRSTADELNSMIGGHIELAIDSMTTLWPQAQAGAIRALAVTSAKRVASAPDLPTIGETLNGFSVSGWQGLFAPAGTPRPIVDRLASEVKRIFELPEVAGALRNAGGEPAPMTPEQFADFIAGERPKWQAVVKASGVQID